MMELNVTLAFACCGCEDDVQVTIQCRGEKLRDRDLPTVNVPCPSCGTINQLSFDSDGTVRSVRPCVCYRPLPQPSLN